VFVGVWRSGGFLGCRSSFSVGLFLATGRSCGGGAPRAKLVCVLVVAVVEGPIELGVVGVDVMGVAAAP
jgi:hypothetical protein